MKIEIQRNGTLLESDERLLKEYFAKVIELANKERTNKFVVDMDDVWPLAYARRQECVRALRKFFVENEDFVIREKSTTIGRPSQNVIITLQCMEFLVARKVRPVFEVYRQVFHAAVQEKQKSLNTFVAKNPIGFEIPGSEDLNVPFSQRTFEKGWINLAQYGWRDFFYFFAMDSELNRLKEGKTGEEQWKDVLLSLISFANLTLHIMIDRHIMSAESKRNIEDSLREMNMWRSYIETHNIVTKEPLKYIYEFDNSTANLFRVLTTQIPKEDIWPTHREKAK